MDAERRERWCGVFGRDLEGLGVQERISAPPSEEQSKARHRGKTWGRLNVQNPWGDCKVWGLFFFTSHAAFINSLKNEKPETD